MTTALANAPQDVRLTLDGREATAHLRMPDLEEMLLLWYLPATRTPERAAVAFPAEIERIVDTLDGETVERAEAAAIYADPAAFRDYLVARNAWLQITSERGMLYAQCPHCRGWEADLGPLALAAGLRTTFWPTVDADQWLAPPALALDDAVPLRDASTARSSRLRVALPSARIGHAAAIREVVFARVPEPAREQAAEAGRAELVRTDPGRYGDWNSRFAGVRALLLLAARLDEVDGAAPTLPALAELPLCDFLFIDNVYHLTHRIALPADSPLRLRCEACGGRFVPLA